jgi:hypothetical protein
MTLCKNGLRAYLVLRNETSFFKKNYMYCSNSNAAGLPDFTWSKHTQTGKIYQMATNGHKL